MAKGNNSGSWKKERASVSTRKSARPRSNKNSPTSDRSKTAEAGMASRYWRAAYTRKDGTRVKGHYVKKAR